VLMAEQRKPTGVFSLKLNGKKTLIEMFPKELWKEKERWNDRNFRFRVNGRWFDKGKSKKFYTIYELRDLLTTDLVNILECEKKDFWFF